MEDAARKPEVPEALGRLERAVSDMAEAQGILEECLRAVVHPRVACDVPNPDPSADDVPLVIRIDTSRHNVIALSAAIRDMVTRLEL